MNWIMLWLGFGYTPGASSSKQLGSQHWGKKIIRIFPLTWIHQQGAAFGTVPSDLFRSTMCRWCYTWLMYMIWCYMYVVHCWYAIMNCLGIWNIIWLWYLSGGRGLDCWYCYIVGILLLIMTDWSGLSRRICFVRLCVVNVYGYGRVPYAWILDLFRSSLCRWCILLDDVISLTGR